MLSCRHEPDPEFLTGRDDVLLEHALHDRVLALDGCQPRDGMRPADLLLGGLGLTPAEDLALAINSPMKEATSSPADSLSKIAFDDGLFKDEADLNGFVRWILRCQAKREAGTLEP